MFERSRRVEESINLRDNSILLDLYHYISAIIDLINRSYGASARGSHVTKSGQVLKITINPNCITIKGMTPR